MVPMVDFVVVVMGMMVIVQVVMVMLGVGMVPMAHVICMRNRIWMGTR